MNERHAYLIIAHNEPELLYKLLSALDYENNDIYLHIDKKADCFSESCLKQACKNSKLHYVVREKVSWGGYSLIKVELSLLEKALKNGPYKYYHLISGVDVPLKNQKEMHAFFKNNEGKEFIHFCDDEFNKKQKTRYSRYHFFQDHIGRSTKTPIYFCEKALLKAQDFLGIDRSEAAFCYKGGSQWFSITDSLANYIIMKKPLIKKMFKYSLCCDEFFIQTLVYNSNYYKNIYNIEKIPSYITCMRYVDWKRGNPYVFKIQDIDELLNSGFLFARKFSTSEEKSRKCALEIYERISASNV